MTATLQSEQYSSFFAFSSSDSTDRGASWEEEVVFREGGAALDGEEVTEDGGQDFEEEEEEDERPGAGRAEGGLDGGGSLPTLLAEGEEERGEVEEGRQDLGEDRESLELDSSSA